MMTVEQEDVARTDAAEALLEARYGAVIRPHWRSGKWVIRGRPYQRPENRRMLDELDWDTFAGAVQQAPDILERLNHD